MDNSDLSSSMLEQKRVEWKANPRPAAARVTHRVNIEPYLSTTPHPPSRFYMCKCTYVGGVTRSGSWYNFNLPESLHRGRVYVSVTGFTSERV